MPRLTLHCVSLNRLRPLRNALVRLPIFWYRRVWGIDIHPSCEMSLSAKLDLSFLKDLHVSARTYALA